MGNLINIGISDLNVAKDDDTLVKIKVESAKK